jgi:hypothetical protein
MAKARGSSSSLTTRRGHSSEYQKRRDLLMVCPHCGDPVVKKRLVAHMGRVHSRTDREIAKDFLNVRPYTGKIRPSGTVVANKPIKKSPSAKKKTKAKATARERTWRRNGVSVWTVSGGLPSLGRRR